MMRIIDSRSPTSPLVAIGGDLRASLLLEPTLPEAINRLTAALDRVEGEAQHGEEEIAASRKTDRGPAS
jgi:hypothetical protein